MAAIAPCGSIVKDRTSPEIASTGNNTMWRTRLCGASADITPPNARTIAPRTCNSATAGTMAQPTRKVRASSGARRSPSASTTPAAPPPITSPARLTRCRP